MSYNTLQSIQQLWQQFLQDQLSAMPAEQRQQFEGAFEDRLMELSKSAANGATPHDGFIDLLGLGDKGAPPFTDISCGLDNVAIRHLCDRQAG